MKVLLKILLVLLTVAGFLYWLLFKCAEPARWLRRRVDREEQQNEELTEQMNQPEEEADKQ